VRVAPYILVPTPGTGKPNPGVALARRTLEGRQRLLCPRKTTPNAHQKNNFRNLAWRSGMLDLPRRTMPETKPSKPAQQCRGMQRSLERSQTTKKHPARRSRETTFSERLASQTNLKKSCIVNMKTDRPASSLLRRQTCIWRHNSHSSSYSDSWNVMKCLNSTNLHSHRTPHPRCELLRTRRCHSVHLELACSLSINSFSVLFIQQDAKPKYLQQQRSSEIKSPISLSTKNDPSSVWRKISLNLKSFWRSKVKKWRS